MSATQSTPVPNDLLERILAYASSLKPRSSTLVPLLLATAPIKIPLALCTILRHANLAALTWLKSSDDGETQAPSIPGCGDNGGETDSPMVDDDEDEFPDLTHYSKASRDTALLFCNLASQLVRAPAQIPTLLDPLVPHLVRNPPMCAKLVESLGMAGCVEALEHLANVHQMDLLICDTALGQATANGHLRVLNWWRNNVLAGEPLVQEYDLNDPGVLYRVAEKGAGSASIFEWWALELGAEFKFDSFLVANAACAGGNVAVLDWLWTYQGGRFKVMEQTHFNAACRNGHPHVLDWLMERAHSVDDGYVPEIDDCVEQACEAGQVKVLDWLWRRFGSLQQFRYSAMAMDKASMNGHVAILEWLAQSGLEMRYTPSGLALASKFGHQGIVGWWTRNCTAACLNPSSGCSAQDMPHDLITLASHGHADVIRRLNLMPSAADLRSDYRLRLEHLPLMDAVCRAGQIRILDAFQDQFTLLAESSSDPLVSAAKFNQTHVLDWWQAHSPQNAYWDNIARAVGEFGALESLTWMLDRQLLAVDMDQAPSFLDYIPPGRKPHIATVFDHAVSNGHVAILDYCAIQGFIDPFTFGNASEYLSESALYGHVDVIRWWIGHTYPVGPQAAALALARAIEGNQVQVVRELLAHPVLREDLLAEWEMQANETMTLDAVVAFCDEIASGKKGVVLDARLLSQLPARLAHVLLSLFWSREERPAENIGEWL